MPSLPDKPERARHEMEGQDASRARATLVRDIGKDGSMREPAPVQKTGDPIPVSVTDLAEAVDEGGHPFFTTSSEVDRVSVARGALDRLGGAENK